MTILWCYLPDTSPAFQIFPENTELDQRYAYESQSYILASKGAVFTAVVFVSTLT